MSTKVNELAKLERKAADAAQMLRLVANEHRLLILCRLAVKGEMTVGELTTAAGISQSALSQHLSKMREEGVVATRRDAQTIHYRIINPEVRRLLDFLKQIYCP